MSEQTPESAASAMDDDPMGTMSDGADEPSMEDILASIRKIIADDPDPMPLDGPNETAAPDALRRASIEAVSDPVVDLADTAFQAESDADELDLDALLNDMHVAEPEMPPAFESADIVDGVPAYNAASSAPGIDAALAIPDMPDDSSAPAADDGEDDMDRLMNEMLSDMQDMPIPDPVIPTAVAPSSEAPMTAPVVDMMDQDDDLDLVKSLMADLTDDDETDTPDMLAVDSVVEATGSLDLDVAETIEDPDSDILDSILDMTLADEIASGPDATVEAQSDSDDDVTRVSISAVSATAVAASVIAASDDDAASEEAVPSLTDIAFAAEADLGEVVSPESDTQDDQASDIIADMIEAADQTVGPDAVSETADQDMSDPRPPQETQPLETPMPRAVRSDAILDEVTEEASMSAFAQLNQVVEDKAVLTERGPRIGDLVQDALKPMLKEWLDENLQAIVERAVAKEVKRLSTGK